MPPATTLLVDANGARSVGRYWRLDYCGQARSDSDEEARGAAARAAGGADAAPMISEVPLGAFLSGGSRLERGRRGHGGGQISEPVKTFSIGFRDADFDELRYARLVAERFATDHHEFIVEPDALEIMPKLARHYGEPFADPSAIRASTSPS